MSYNSNFKGAEIQAKLEKVTELNVAARDLGVEVEDVVFDYATMKDVSDAIEQAITNALNTEV